MRLVGGRSPVKFGPRGLPSRASLRWGREERKTLARSPSVRIRSPLLAAGVTLSPFPNIMSQVLKSVDYEIFGRVQGVCFRMCPMSSPEKFDGSPDQFQAFLSHCQLYMQLHSENFHIDQEMEDQKQAELYLYGSTSVDFARSYPAKKDTPHYWKTGHLRPKWALWPGMAKSGSTPDNR
ncbi:hypothetical protein JD844_025630 [Phrynosoma platyrhinos]|uniref:Uncharacterized protein n=1 Tax=Phrynosoma platyrhinos TaxID=52577 RepID=A0ABQ7SZH6_PHRPL|nr:hypothetical protein JD844_025630 [Phrynosoma platyrhinos]